MKKKPLFDSNTYIAIETFGNCKSCGKYQDLRYGACFDCASHVTIDNKGICTDEKTGKSWKIIKH